MALTVHARIFHIENCNDVITCVPPNTPSEQVEIATGFFCHSSCSKSPQDVHAPLGGQGDLVKDRWNILLTGRLQYNNRIKAIDQKLYDRANDIPGATYPTSFRAFPGRIMDFGFSPGAYAGTLTTNPNFAPCDPNYTFLQTSGTTPSGAPRYRCRGLPRRV